MLLTESEASLMWCPMARVSIGAGSPYNRTADGKPSGASFCISSACMMWGWAGTNKEDYKIGYCKFR